MSALTVEEQLQWEAEWAPRAAVSAAVSALFTLAAFVYGALSPQSTIDELTTQLLFFDRHSTNFVATGVLLALGALALAPTLLFLYRATKFRRPQLQRAAEIAAVAGAVMVAVFGVAGQFVLAGKAHEFATHGAHTYQQAKHLVGSAGFQVVQSLSFAGQIALGFGLVMIALNAMRVGLLTRFMGIVGILVGVFTVLQQLLPPAPVLEAFWLGALAYLLSGRWPSGVPPAWSSGKAEPWPSQQEAREARERGKQAPSEVANRKAEPVPAGAGSGTSHPRSKKRKRKRRT